MQAVLYVICLCFSFLLLLSLVWHHVNTIGINIPDHIRPKQHCVILAAWIFVNVQMHCPLIIFWVLRPVYLYHFQMGSFIDRQPSRLHENCVGDFLQDIQCTDCWGYERVRTRYGSLHTEKCSMYCELWRIFCSKPSKLKKLADFEF